MKRNWSSGLDEKIMVCEGYVTKKNEGLDNKQSFTLLLLEELKNLGLTNKEIKLYFSY
jgi:hypothetical protein